MARTQCATKIAVGHLGTLDPQARVSVAVGKATAVLLLLTDQRKAYACTLVLGRAPRRRRRMRAAKRSNGGAFAGASIWMRCFRASSRSRKNRPADVSAVHHEGRRLCARGKDRRAARAARDDLRHHAAGIRFPVARRPGSDGAAADCVARARTYVRLSRHWGGHGIAAHIGALVREASGRSCSTKLAPSTRSRKRPSRRSYRPNTSFRSRPIVLDLRGSADFRAGRVVPLPEGAGGPSRFVRDESRTLVGGRRSARRAACAAQSVCVMRVHAHVRPRLRPAAGAADRILRRLHLGDIARSLVYASNAKARLAQRRLDVCESSRLVLAPR